MYCLDSNVIIDFLRGDKKLAGKFSEVITSGAEVFITPITLCELYRGAYGYFDPQKKLEEVNYVISNFELLEFDSNSCGEFGKIHSKLEKSGKLIAEFDLIIASIVKAHDLILVTRDKDFENTGVKLEVW